MKIMSILRHSICKDKRGSYILEATIVIPIFIVAMVMLIALIPIIGTCENISYSVADEMRLEAGKSSLRKNSKACPVSTYARVTMENKDKANFIINRYKYLYSENGIYDLISIDFRSTFSKKDPIGLYGKVKFNGRIVCRAFTGRKRYMEAGNLTDDEKSEPVYVFPESGRKYHGKECTYVKASCRLTYLNQELKRKYHPCHKCNARASDMGSSVFCFDRFGKAYHTGVCKSVDRYFIEVEKDEAERKRYAPCSKCGGK